MGIGRSRETGREVDRRHGASEECTKGTRGAPDASGAVAITMTKLRDLRRACTNMKSQARVPGGSQTRWSGSRVTFDTSMNFRGCFIGLDRYASDQITQLSSAVRRRGAARAIQRQRRAKR
jgi:hypothetical protein